MATAVAKCDGDMSADEKRLMVRTTIAGDGPTVTQDTA